MSREYWEETGRVRDRATDRCCVNYRRSTVCERKRKAPDIAVEAEVWSPMESSNKIW
jgi:hypothetical protein